MTKTLQTKCKTCLGVLEWFCMLSEKILFQKSSMVFLLPLLTPPPPSWKKTITNTLFFWNPFLIRFDWPYNINYILNSLAILWHLDLTVWFESLTVWFDQGNRISRLLKITEGRCSAASKASLIKTFKILQNLPFWNGRRNTLRKLSI